MAKQQKSHPLRLWFFRKKGNLKGFTLIELLVALFIGGIIVSLLLFTVVQLLQTNQREASRSDTQREMQMAIDYISRDLREAVFVYDGRCLTPPGDATLTCPGLTNYLPPEIAGSGNTDNIPVLAFWKVDPLPDTLIVSCKTNARAIATTTNSANLPPAVVGVPCISRQMYTLVVYSLSGRAEDNWRGRARIKRYQLPQFTSNTPAGSPQQTPGWYYPAGQDTNFSRWPLSASGSASLQTVRPAIANTPNQVLVDFVDLSGSVADAACPATAQPASPALPLPQNYVITPAPNPLTNTPARGFYVCVKGATSNGTLNQEVVVRIQGNAAGRPGIPRDRASVPIPMETRVLIRGVLNKV
ncbi:PilW family protein [Phormidesmis priestleyi]